MQTRVIMISEYEKLCEERNLISLDKFATENSEERNTKKLNSFFLRNTQRHLSKDARWISLNGALLTAPLIASRIRCENGNIADIHTYFCTSEISSFFTLLLRLKCVLVLKCLGSTVTLSTAFSPPLWNVTLLDRYWKITPTTIYHSLIMSNCLHTHCCFILVITFFEDTETNFHETKVFSMIRHLSSVNLDRRVQLSNFLTTAFVTNKLATRQIGLWKFTQDICMHREIVLLYAWYCVRCVNVAE